MGIGQITLTLVPLVNPETGKEFIAKELKWTDNYNYQGYLRVDDSIATNGFDATIFPYFAGTYDKCPIVRMGVPTPKGCINVTPIERVTDPADPNYDVSKNNKMLNAKWFFIIRATDVWGRPSEWGARSEEYVAALNDCIANSNNIPRCVNLEFDAGNPFWNTIEIGWIACVNGVSTVWKKEETLFLYKGSNIGEWWKRQRNPDIAYDQVKNTITYKFCRDKECDVIPTDETTRIENPLPKRSSAIMDLNHETALFNNKSKFNPFSQDLISKITHTVLPPSQTDIGLRNITIYAAIYNEFLQGPPDYQGKFVAVVPDGNNGYYFGGITSNNQYSGAWAERYQQRFKNKAQSGFCGYLVGGGSVISTQVVEQSDGTL